MKLNYIPVAAFMMMTAANSAAANDIETTLPQAIETSVNDSYSEDLYTIIQDVKWYIASIMDIDEDEIGNDYRLIQDLGMDSLNIDELCTFLENDYMIANNALWNRVREGSRNMSVIDVAILVQSLSPIV